GVSPTTRVDDLGQPTRRTCIRRGDGGSRAPHTHAPLGKRRARGGAFFGRPGLTTPGRLVAPLRTRLAVRRATARCRVDSFTVRQSARRSFTRGSNGVP